MSDNFSVYDYTRDAVRASRSDPMTIMLPADKLQASADFYARKTADHYEEIVDLGAFFAMADLCEADKRFTILVSSAGGKAVDDASIGHIIADTIQPYISAFTRCDVSTDRLYFRDVSGAWILRANTCAGVSVEALSNLLSILFPQVFTALDSRSIRFARGLRSTIEHNEPSLHLERVQFADAVLTVDGVSDLSSAVNNEPPTFISTRSIARFVETRQHTRPVEAVDDLLRHVAGDDATLDRLLDKFAMPLVFDVALRKESQEFVFLYGRGGTGKSTMLDLVIRAYGDNEMSAAVNLSKFDGFFMEQAIGKLVLVDTDCSNGFIEAGPTDNLKKLVSGERIQINRKNKSVVNYQAHASLFVAGNKLPRSTDKSTGWLRRLDLYNVDKELVRPNEWWVSLHSDEAACYMFEKLLDRALMLVHTKRLHPPTPSMTLLKNEFVLANDSVMSWIDEAGLTRDKDILYMPPKLLYGPYLQWCEDNGELAKCGRNEFISRIKSQFDCDLQPHRISASKMPRAFEAISLSRESILVDGTLVKVFVPRSESKG